MGTYHQLTEHQRYQIYALKKAGHDLQSIAATVSVSPSTICRELRRNQGQRGYRPGQAHHKALARRRSKATATKMTAAVIERIEADLGQQWSPEQIAGRLAAIRLKRIYQHIQADRQAGGNRLSGPQRLDHFRCELAGSRRADSLGLGQIHRVFYIRGYYVVAGCTRADSSTTTRASAIEKKISGVRHSARKRRFDDAILPRATRLDIKRLDVGGSAPILNEPR